ncbi:unnamed protein product [marine sediment metagenome]|uniref:Uncharacterized protein n=1 Tax=marine sediment metagenome TaxID=412755 RepID=X1DTV8_9ZZZZ
MFRNQEIRKAAIDSLLEFVREQCSLAEDKVIYQPRLVDKYSFKSGISARTLNEYFDVLLGAGLIKNVMVGRYWRIGLPE